MQAAEERYLAQNGVYTADMSQLDIILPTLQYFTCTSFAAPIADGSGLRNSLWTGCLTRIPGSSSYGPYTVIWNQDCMSLGVRPRRLLDPASSLVSAVCSRIAYSDQKRPWCSYLLPAEEGEEAPPRLQLNGKTREGTGHACCLGVLGKAVAVGGRRRSLDPSARPRAGDPSRPMIGSVVVSRQEKDPLDGGGRLRLTGVHLPAAKGHRRVTLNWRHWCITSCRSSLSPSPRADTP